MMQKFLSERPQIKAQIQNAWKMIEIYQASIYPDKKRGFWLY